MSMSVDTTDDTHETTPEAPVAEPNPIRSAFLARASAASSAAGGLSDAAASGVALRGAYLARLDDNATEAVGAAPAGVDSMLRSAYAARLAAGTRGAAAPRLPRAKAARRAKKVRAKTKKAAKPKAKHSAKLKAKRSAKPKVKRSAKPARAAAKRARAKRPARRRR
ncbi:MAG TPA: hypothetical protein VMB81_15430 [Candidatus Sulfotelmatobacter sp.]|nr:hypothetical protein [Candidatus Sulfotelmatobacter sp.]